MKFEEARKMAEKYIETDKEKTLITCIDVKTYGWIFFYNSLRFVESGTFLNSDTGNIPFLITKNGKLIPLLIAHNGGFDETLKKIEREYGLEDEFAKDLENPNQKGSD